MNEDEAGPHRARRRLAADRRPARGQQLALGPARRRARALPDGQRRPAVVAQFPDRARRPHPAGILDRCELTDTCPKIVETFGGAEVFALKMTTSWVGTVRRTTSRCPTTCAAITCRARRTAAATAASPRIRRPPAPELPGQQLGHGHAAREPGAAPRSWSTACAWRCATG